MAEHTHHVANEKSEVTAAEGPEVASTDSPTTHPRELEGVPARQTRGGKVKAFIRRFWWLLLIMFVIGTLIVVLPFVYVGIPNIAQHEVNKSTLEITNQTVTDPKPDSVHLQLSQTAHSSSSFHPWLYEFRAALYLEETEPNIIPFGYIDVPKSKVTKNTVINIDQNLHIENLDQFKAYTALTIKNDTYRIGVKGKTKLKLSGLKAFDVDYNQKVTMKGLNGLAGLTVSNFTILLQNEPDGTNMVGTVSIPNPSVLTVDMGNVTMDLSVDGKPIGTTLLPNLLIKPGDNTVPMRSITNQSAVITMITSKYHDGILPIQIVGNSSVNAAGEHLEYFESAIQGNPVNLKLDVGKALLALGLNVTSS